MSNKRQRTTTESLYITDLPDGILVGISSYLAKPSAVLFAMTIDHKIDSYPTQTSEAIISSIDWSVLDFDDIEKSLAAKLSDDDIDKILKSIGANSYLHILKLAGCVNITGRGLDMLRLSTVLQQIDMSLVGKYESPLLDPEPLLSESVVITILDDIISNVSSLKHLEFPKKWRKEVGGSVLHQFLERYNTYLRNQRLNCSLCARVCVDDEDEEEWICRDRDEWYGIQNFTCCGCLNHFCYRDGCDKKIIWCKKCEKECCKSCSAGYYCINCDEKFCNKCIEMKACEGDNCETTFCEGCSKHYVCSFCGELKCQSCDSDRSHCSKCDIVACSECLSKQHWGKDDKCECGEWLEEYGFL